MTISAYLPTSGASFSPESATNMGKAFDGVVDILGIGPEDETQRERENRAGGQVGKRQFDLLRIYITIDHIGWRKIGDFQGSHVGGRLVI